MNQEIMAMLRQRKGIADRVPLVLFMVGMVGVIILVGVGTLVLAAFNDSLETDSNTSTIDSPGQTVFSNSVTMLRNFTTQLGTAGTIAGVLILVILVALAGIGLFNYGRGRGLF